MGYLDFEISQFRNKNTNNLRIIFWWKLIKRSHSCKIGFIFMKITLPVPCCYLSSSVWSFFHQEMKEYKSIWYSYHDHSSNWTTLLDGRMLCFLASFWSSDCHDLLSWLAIGLTSHHSLDVKVLVLVCAGSISLTGDGNVELCPQYCALSSSHARVWRWYCNCFFIFCINIDMPS